MTTPQPADPRIAPLLDLVQGLMGKYSELASNLAAHLPDRVRAELVEHTQTLLQEARDRFTEIAAIDAPRAAQQGAHTGDTSPYRLVDIDGDWIEIRPTARGVIRLDSFDAATEHRVITAVPVGRADELVAAIRAAAVASGGA